MGSSCLIQLYCASIGCLLTVCTIGQLQEQDYAELSQWLLNETRAEQAPKANLAAQLGLWHTWADAKFAEGKLTDQQRRVCFGPHPSVTVFDRAAIDGTRFTCTRLEGAKRVKDSLVLVRVGAAGEQRLRAARVQAFLCHAAPGTVAAELSDEADLAYVHWNADVPADQPSIDPELGCPVFREVLIKNDLGGNMCPVESILPYKMAAAPYRHGTREQLVVLSRCSTFMDDV